MDGIGCPTAAICMETAFNPLGDCDCGEQFFLSEDCQTGFFCIDDGALDYDGCIMNCNEGEILFPDFANREMVCVPESSATYICPGFAKLECPANEVTPNSDDCDCDNGQVIISSDCREAFFCRSNLINGGILLSCPEGQIFQFDEDWGHNCVIDTGNCPGLGGYKLGCTSGNPTPPPHPGCDEGKNTLGTCECEGQFFINGDCTQGFSCDSTLGTDFEGCSKTCNDGSILLPDFSTNSWACVGNWNGERVCPGEFESSCTEVALDQTSCECDGQILVNSDCSSSFLCITDFPGGGFRVDCDDYVFDISLFLRGQIQACTSDTSKCPGGGGYKLGCKTANPTLPPPLECRDNNTYYSSANPLGTCACEGHLWVGDDCKEGFYCLTEDTQQGCYIVRFILFI